jgi:hypothetical protein
MLRCAGARDAEIERSAAAYRLNRLRWLSNHGAEALIGRTCAVCG